jgi:hypothetical protein
MGMQDAFQYFTRMAQLVAQDSVPGDAADAAPTEKATRQPSHGPAGLIRVVRARLRAHLDIKKRTAAVHSFMAAADTRHAKGAAA